MVGLRPILGQWPRLSRSVDDAPDRRPHVTLLQSVRSCRAADDAAVIKSKDGL